jgi:phosphoenolpyruvate phosphomutase
MTKAKKLREILQSQNLEFILEAHNGLSAAIVEEAGFSGIWASGLSMSAALGVRDNNEASWTQVLEVLEFMSDRTTIPILVDADTGYGNFNNARRLVRKLEQRGIAGMCIEDKLFPKTNSFINGTRQPLADIQEFCGKIRAIKDSQSDPDFTLVARIEALIAGHEMEEALERGSAYFDAGADAILIHSKQARADEILEFLKGWTEPCPVVIVPTMYFETPTEVFEQAGASMVIWANHMLRAAISVMQRTASEIREQASLMTIEPKIATVREIFRLQNAEELQNAEKIYLPSRQA